MELGKREILIWLSHIEGVTRGDISLLTDYFYDIQEIWHSDVKYIRNALSKREATVGKILEKRNEEFILKIFNELNENSITPITILDKDYPPKLKVIHDPPYVIYIKGRERNFDIPLIAIVGARKATPYGKWAAYQFSRELAKWGVGTVSGLALGIDAAGHKGALDGDGYTIGVLGCGLDQCYPASNRKLMDEMLLKGCIITEYCIGTPPLKYNFPARNRIVSALSDGVIVIEASEKSGALITVEFALEHGKDVYALPGNINSIQSKGSNMLIRDGARILLSVDDVIENLNYKFNLIKKSMQEAAKQDLSELEMSIYEIIKRNPINIDLICHEAKIKAGELNSILTILEIKGFISQLPGKTFTVVK